MDFGPTLREIRYRLLLTQAMVATGASISRSEVSLWENGRKRPRPAALDRLVGALCCAEFTQPVPPLSAEEAAALRRCVQGAYSE